jgi:hypothetical protein
VEFPTKKEVTAGCCLLSLCFILDNVNFGQIDDQQTDMSVLNFAVSLQPLNCGSFHSYFWHGEHKFAKLETLNGTWYQ